MSAPYYDEGGVSIWHGDCREVLPSIEDGAVDAVLTDPPYNVSDRNGRDGTTPGQLQRRDGTYRKLWKDFGEWDRAWDGEPFVAETTRVLRDGGSLLAFTSEFTLSLYLGSELNHRCVWYWRKSNPVPAFRKLYVRAVEMGVWQVKGTGGWTFNAGGYRPNMFEGATVAGFSTVNDHEPRYHPTQKPLWLIQTLMALHTNAGDLVVDPYMGSGTTLLAALKMGRRAVGIEISERYCEIAAKRLAQGVLPFDDPPHRATVDVDTRGVL